MMTTLGVFCSKMLLYGQENGKLERLFGILIAGIQDDDGDGGGYEGEGDDGDDHRHLEDDGGDNDRGGDGGEFELQLFLFWSPHSINSILNIFLALRQNADGCESCDITIDDGYELQLVVELRILLSKTLACLGLYL